MRLSLSLGALAALASLSSAVPNGWSKTKSAEDSPTKLDDCGCWPIYQAMLRCQKLSGPNANTRDCVCIPNPDGWYGSMDGCRNCLAPGSLEDNFFDNMSRLVTQLFVSCTNAGGGVTSDGTSICASNYYREACVSLGTGGKPSWASFEVFESQTKGNASYVLDIAEHGADAGEQSSSSTGTAATTTTTATDASDVTSTTTETSSTATTSITNEPSPAGSGTSDDASGTETGPGSATTTPSSAVGLVGARTLAGRIAGVMMAVAVGTVLL
jgi:hypothetical protein